MSYYLRTHLCKFELISTPQAPGVFGIFFLKSYPCETIKFVSPSLKEGRISTKESIYLTSVYSHFGNRKHILVTEDYMLRCDTGVMKHVPKGTQKDIYVFENECIEKLNWFVREGSCKTRMEMESPWDLMYMDNLDVLHALNARPNRQRSHKHYNELNFLLPEALIAP